MQHDSPVPLDAVATQGNNLGAAGVEALRPALEKLTKLTILNLDSTCGAVVVRKLGVCGVARRQLCVQHDSPVPLDAVAAPANDLGADGAKALCPALEKLANLTFLYLDSECVWGCAAA